MIEKIRSLTFIRQFTRCHLNWKCCGNTLTLSQFRRSTNDKLWWCVFSLLNFATIAVRFYKLHYPQQVCWDETHFGRYANNYLLRTFFFDVHPPLGKMFIGLFGFLDGYDGSFHFNNGNPYGDTPYMGMRIGCATLGALVVPICFLTIWEMTSSLPASTFTSICLIFDNGLVVLNRFILLDPILLFFIAATVYSMARFNKLQHTSFNLHWWFWLSATGFFMTAAISVKFVGCFVVLFVGFRMIHDMWVIFGDLKKPMRYILCHLYSRTICLVLLPIALYLSIFYIHLNILHLSGNEDEFFSSSFQVSLKGNVFYNSFAPREVVFGAAIRLKNSGFEGQYLHSHRKLYPVGARQQQITTVYERDPNNLWYIKRQNQPCPLWNSTEPIDLVRNGDIIRLQHQSTGRNVHVFQGPAPISENMFQVTGYGMKEESNDDDFWRLDIEDGKKGEVLNIMSHNFRLVSTNNKCVLTSTSKTLPKWGFGSAEVACNLNLRDHHAVWHVDDNIHPRLSNVSYVMFELNFFQRFLESHKKMIAGNSGFRPKRGEFHSRPWMWPINYKGQFFSIEGVLIYLLGNPIVWWGHCIFLIIYFVLWLTNSVMKKRSIILSYKQTKLQNQTLKACKWLFIGYVCHFAPFWSMGRILYFHHYFPALIFSNMISGVMLNYILETLCDKVSQRFYFFSVLSIVLSFIYSFYLFTPITYGYPNRPSQFKDSEMHGMKWVSSWEF